MEKPMQLKIAKETKWFIELLEGTDWDAPPDENPTLYWVRIYLKGEEVACKKFLQLQYAEEYFELAVNYHYRTF
jgi:hypothetical protein